MSNQSFFQRRSQVGLSLANEAKARQTNALTENAQAIAERHDATFRRTTSKVSSDFRQKQRQKQDLYLSLKEEFLAEVVMAACPIDLGNISLEEMVQQVAAARDTYSKIVTKTVDGPISFSLPAGTDVGSPSHTAIMIGSMNSKTPARIAQMVLSAKVATGTKNCRSDAGVSTAVNVVDTTIHAGGNSEEGLVLEDLKKLVVANCSKVIKESVVENIRRDKESAMITTEDLTEGLTPFGKLQMERKIAKSAGNSLLKEVYKTTKTLNEGVTANESDFFHEAVFVTTILETFNMFGLIECTMSDVAVALDAQRRAFNK